MKPQRNDPCPCGSGKKHKNCCAIQRSSSQRLWTIGAALIAVILVGVAGVVFYEAMTGEPPAPPVGQVWHEEGGHYHEVPEPEGGGVWSAEHTHWHELDGSEIGSVPPPPEGAVWSEEHNHWHTADGQEVAASELRPANATWSDEHEHWHDEFDQCLTSSAQ